MKKHKATTLIETVVAIALVSLFAVITVPGFKRQTLDQQLEQTVSDIKSAVYSARSLAYSPKIQYDGTQYYYLYINPTSRTLTYWRYNSLSDPAPVEITGMAKSLPNKLNYSAMTGVITKISFSATQNQFKVVDGKGKPISPIIIKGKNHCARIWVDETTGRPESAIRDLQGNPSCN